jgi:hypothetical protein
VGQKLGVRLVMGKDSLVKISDALFNRLALLYKKGKSMKKLLRYDFLDAVLMSHHLDM